ncbi:MAG: phospholipase domain protein [Myxococcaceae bacterium]|nr:phospholipase domain protein [Myxococcaceae bacterium]
MPVNDAPPPGANHAEMLVDGHHILPALLADLRAARREIHVSMFLFFRDPVGLEIAAVLCDKAAAGVTVRVLLNLQKTAMGDPFSTGEKEMIEEDPNVDYDPTEVGPLCEQLKTSGVEVVDTNIDYDADRPHLDERLRSVAAQIRDVVGVDDLHIDHRKLVIVDRRVAYTGGANIGAQYMNHAPFDPAVDARAEAEAWRDAGSREPWRKWHDSLTRFEGPVVADINAHFYERWLLDGGDDFALAPEALAPADGPPRGIPVDAATVLVNAPDGVPNPVRELYLALIATAQRSIFVENPYSYHPAIIAALVAAKTARPELDVTVVLPALEWNDNEYAHDAQQFHYAALIACGVAVYEYQNHFTHLKTAVFDERWSIHGSTNLNFRSLEDDMDFELVVLVDGPALAADVLARVRDVDVTHARRFTAADLDGSLAGLRITTRDPRTLLLLERRAL